MNKNFKITLTSAIALGLLTTSVAFAEYNPDKVIDPTNPIMTTSVGVTKPIFAITINGTGIEANTYVKNDTVMIPLRTVAETLGYKVSWDEGNQKITLIRGPHYITLSPTEDEYTFSKMAPMKLGVAPELFEDRTYVPIAFIKDVVQAEYKVEENGTITITDGEDVTDGTVLEEPIKNVEVIKVNDDKTILVKDKALGEVLVRITDETSMIKKEIKAGDIISVQYSPAMTLSLPPQTNAVKIGDAIKEDEKEEDNENLKAIEITAKIKEVMENDQILIAVDDSEMDVVLNISKDTIIKHNKDKKAYTLADLKKDMKISVKHSPAMTRSLPPQTAAFEIIIND